ncbi:hypothetical protein FFLO_03496 [Filobasidium floriforme]|uniref:Prenyltransferase alpha-alpha toroid domain-containing protein n=1 Tax=Filobasidium floriforme TaxID=5210 RepID=A0A8K0NQT9_9TREE|nr:hypothetical protein FFLO_03496 [Filobasidium floriforme]
MQSTSSRQSTFKRNAHVAYFRRCLQAMPSKATEGDGNRMTLGYFCVGGLDLLGYFEDVLEGGEDEAKRKTRDSWIEWVWEMQDPNGGFRGSSYMNTDKAGPSTSAATPSNPAHLPSTYTAILILGILRADLSRLNRRGLWEFVNSCQEPDGSYATLPLSATPHRPKPSFESDARMVYCASVIRDWIRFSGLELSEQERRADEVAVEKTRKWIAACQTWEGGFGGRPGLEAQGGTTYCCVTAASLLGSTSFDSESASRWLSQRQVSDGEGGFQGRPGKDEDVCYSFWCGAAMRVLTGQSMFDVSANSQALLGAQSPIGGFGKAAGEFPDPFHSYLALAALAMNEETLINESESGSGSMILDLQPLDPVWNVTRNTRAYLESALARL